MNLEISKKYLTEDGQFVIVKKISDVSVTFHDMAGKSWLRTRRNITKWRKCPEMGELWEDIHGDMVTITGFDQNGDPEYKYGVDGGKAVDYLGDFMKNHSLLVGVSTLEEDAPAQEQHFDHEHAHVLETIADQAINAAKDAVKDYNDYIKSQPRQFLPKNF